MKKNIIIFLVFLFSIIFISGCVGILSTPDEDLLEPEDDSITSGKGRLKIYLTNTSGDYKANDSENYSAVNVTISKIQVHLAGENEEDEGEWIEWELNENDGKTFDLIVLKEEGLSALLSEVDIDPGKYTQIRLFVSESTISVEIEGTRENSKAIEVVGEVLSDTFDVEIPSAYQTGLKLIHSFEINDGQTTELTIDFDAEKSIVKTGNGRYILKPTIKVITNISD